MAHDHKYSHNDTAVRTIIFSRLYLFHHIYHTLGQTTFHVLMSNSPSQSRFQSSQMKARVYGKIGPENDHYSVSK